MADFDIKNAQPVNDQSAPYQNPPEKSVAAGSFDIKSAQPAFSVQNAQPVKSGFWADFGEGTGGVLGLLKAPFTESIPANLIKAGAREHEAHPYLSYVVTPSVLAATDKLREFMNSKDDKPIGQRLKESFGAMVDTAKAHPGQLTGSLLKGLVADPELFLIPGAGGAKAAVTAGRVAEAAGAGAKGVQAAMTAGRTVGKLGTAAGLGGGTEFARELGEDAPLDPAAIGLSSLIATPFAFTQVKEMGHTTKLTPDEIDHILASGTTKAGGVTPKATLTPVANGYKVHVPGETEGKTYPTKAEAEAAQKEVENIGSAYRVMETVPRGAETPSAQRAKLMQDNPFSPEKMAQMVRRPDKDARMSGKELASYWSKAAVSAGIGAGLGAYLDDTDPGTGAAFGAAITLLPRALPRDRRISIEDAINERNGQLAVMARKTLAFKGAIDQAVPEASRRTAIAMWMEGTPGIELNAEEMKVAQAARSFFDSMGQTAVDAGVLKELLRNYVTHIVEENPEAKAKGTVDKILDALMNRERPSPQSGKKFAEHRQYATFQELMKELRGSNLRLKTADIGEVVAIYSKAMFRSVTDKRLLDALKQTPVEAKPPLVMPESEAMGSPSTDPRLERAPVEGEASAGPERLAGQPKLPRQEAGGSLAPIQREVRVHPPGQGATAGEGGQGGPPAEIPPASMEGFLGSVPRDVPGAAARKFAQSRANGMLLQPADRADGNYIILPNRQLQGFAVHRDIAPQLNFIFSARDPNDVTLGLMALNQASKRAVVSFSLFHAKSLLDAYIGAMGVRGVANMKTMKAAALDSFRKGGGNDGIDALIKNGLNVQLPEDVGTDQLHGALDKIANIVDTVLPVSSAGKGAKAIASLNHTLDQFTFANLQTGFKLITGLDAYEKLIKKGLPSQKAAKLAASYANDIYGGLDWFRVANDVGSRIGRDIAYGFFNPAGRRWTQIMLFAPDWTFSTFRAAYKALPGAVDDPALAALHRRYLAKSALYYLTVANGINLITAGHSIFSNDNPTRIQLGDGRTMQFSKHFMEPAEWLRDPVQTADNKLAFLPRELIEMGTGKEYISAHDAAPDIENRALHMAKEFMPINAQQGFAGGGYESALGLVGMPIYGKTEDQKREQKKKDKLAREAKKKAAARHYQRLHQK